MSQPATKSQTPRVYDAKEVDEILQESFSIKEALLADLETAKKEIASLKDTIAKNAGKEKVTLEKVAGDTVTLDEGLKSDLVDDLVSAKFIDSADREKFASELDKDPNNLLKVAKHIVSIASSAPSQGTGVAKQASSRTATAGDWQEWL